MKRIFFIMFIIVALVMAGCSSGKKQSNNRSSLQIYVDKSSGGQAQGGAKVLKLMSEPGSIKLENYDEYIMPNEMGGIAYYYLHIKAFDADGRELDVIPGDVTWSSSVANTISPETGNYNIDFHPKNHGDYTVTANYHGESVSVLIKAVPSKALVIGTNWLGNDVKSGVVLTSNTPTDDINEADLYLKSDGDLSKFKLVAPYGIAKISGTYFYLKDVVVANPDELDFSATSTGYLDFPDLNNSYVVRTKNGGFAKVKTSSYSMAATSTAVSLFYLPIQ